MQRTNQEVDEQLTLVRDVHELDGYEFLGLLVFGLEDLAEAAFSEDFAKFVFVQNGAIVELFAVKCNVVNVSVLDELHVIVHNFQAVLVEQTRCPALFLAAKVATGFF